MAYPLCVQGGVAAEDVDRQRSQLYAAAVEIERAKRQVRRRAIEILQAEATYRQALDDTALREVASWREKLASAISETTRLSEERDDLALRLSMTTSDLNRAVSLNDRLMVRLNQASLDAPR